MSCFCSDEPWFGAAGKTAATEDANFLRAWRALLHTLAVPDIYLDANENSEAIRAALKALAESEKAPRSDPSSSSSPMVQRLSGPALARFAEAAAPLREVDALRAPLAHVEELADAVQGFLGTGEEGDDRHGANEDVENVNARGLEGLLRLMYTAAVADPWERREMAPDLTSTATIILEQVVEGLGGSMTDVPPAPAPARSDNSTEVWEMGKDDGYEEEEFSSSSSSSSSAGAGWSGFASVGGDQVVGTELFSSPEEGREAATMEAEGMDQGSAVSFPSTSTSSSVDFAAALAEVGGLDVVEEIIRGARAEGDLINDDDDDIITSTPTPTPTRITPTPTASASTSVSTPTATATATLPVVNLGRVTPSRRHPRDVKLAWASWMASLGATGFLDADLVAALGRESGQEPGKEVWESATARGDLKRAVVGFARSRPEAYYELLTTPQNRVRLALLARAPVPASGLDRKQRNAFRRLQGVTPTRSSSNASLSSSSPGSGKVDLSLDEPVGMQDVSRCLLAVVGLSGLARLRDLERALPGLLDAGLLLCEQLADITKAAPTRRATEAYQAAVAHLQTTKVSLLILLPTRVYKERHNYPTPLSG